MKKALGLFPVVARPAARQAKVLGNQLQEIKNRNAGSGQKEFDELYLGNANRLENKEAVRKALEGARDSHNKFSAYG